MNKKQIEELIRKGDLIITTPKILSEAVKQSIEHLYKDNGEFSKNRHMANREYESLTDEDFKDISSSIADYITNN
jgi:hypothetical protein